MMGIHTDHDVLIINVRTGYPVPMFPCPENARNVFPPCVVMGFGFANEIDGVHRFLRVALGIHLEQIVPSARNAWFFSEFARDVGRR